MSRSALAKSADELALREARAVRRIGRLFRLERQGRFDRRPIETVRRLIARRTKLVGELTELEAARRSLAAPLPDELGAALGELAQEIGASRRSCEARLEQLDGELRQRRGEGTATGLRGGGGQLLGSG